MTLDTLEPPVSLQRRATTATVWAFAFQAADRSVGAVILVILARLLRPGEFGLFGFALLTIAAVDTFTLTGFNDALIYKRHGMEADLDTAWTFEVVRGGLLALIVFAVAPLVARFFSEPGIVGLLRLVSLVLLLQGAVNIGVVYLSKELDFKRQFAYQISGSLASLIVSVTAALLLRNVWALVLGLLSENAVRLIASFIVHPYRPRLRLDLERLRGLYSYGRWVLGTEIVVYFSREGDNLFVGRVLGAASLGLYQIAFRLANLVTTEITQVVSQVALPTYAQVQMEVERLSKAYVTVLEAIISLALPITAGLVLLGRPLVQVVLGDIWMPMVPAMQVLAVSGLIRAATISAGPLFRAVGRPKLDFWMNTARLVVMAAAIIPLTERYQLVGTALAVLLGVAATLPIWWRAAGEVLPGSRKVMVRGLAPSLAATIVLAGALVAMRMLVGGDDLTALALGVGGGAVVYVAFLWVLWKVWGVGPVGVALRIYGASIRPTLATLFS